MKLLGFSLFGQAIKAAGVGAALMLSVSAGHAQSVGHLQASTANWSGTGTVALSDGTTERIRCKADYKVNGTGLGLKQSLHCASDSYKFDLSSDVTSQAAESPATGPKPAATSSAICRAPPAVARSKCSSKPTDLRPTSPCAPR